MYIWGHINKSGKNKEIEIKLGKVARRVNKTYTKINTLDAILG